MPKLYEYFGLIVLFYANEHEPVHVHGIFQDRESRAEIVVRDGEVVEIRIVPTRSKPLTGFQLKNFRILVQRYADEIVQSWIDYLLPTKLLPYSVPELRLCKLGVIPAL